MGQELNAYNLDYEEYTHTHTCIYIYIYMETQILMYFQTMK